MRDGVPFVEWTGELRYLARLRVEARSQRETEC